MKKLFYLTFIMLLFVTSCNDAPNNDLSNNNQDAFEAFIEEQREIIINSYGNVCASVTDAIDYPEPWTKEIEETFVIPDETIRSMSTCGLLKTFIEYPRVYASSDLFDPVVTKFNNELRENKVAIELFDRNDCFPVLASEYLNIIKGHYYNSIEKGEYIYSGRIDYIEKLLASDICMSVIDDKEKKQIMAIGFTKATKERKTSNYGNAAYTYTMMISIMQSCNYAPFIEEVGARIREGAVGYYLIDPNGDTSGNFLTDSNVELILKHAEEFLNK
ncbi:MAG: hypothetical protein LBV47_06460 [Bacteroidales bacterium]|jgi:hypothetical protein|nr:hypothetical protein [Bacteroidales bacterium]